MDFERTIGWILLACRRDRKYSHDTIAEGTYPGYSVGKNALSDLGALGSPTAFLWNGMLLATSLLLIAGIVMFFRSKALDIPRRGATGVLFVLPAVGLMLVSLFPENLIPTIHFAGALMSFIFGGVSDVYAFRFTKGPFRYFSVLLGVISLLATPVLGVSQGHSSFVDFGVVERIVAYPLIIWYIAFAGYLMGN